MSRKKHQGEPNGDDSTESCDEHPSVDECTHIKKAVDLRNVKKSLEKKGFLKDCEECSKMPPQDEEMNSDDMDFEFDQNLWMCLKCGNQACGRAKHKHALSHFEIPHSDCHALCVNTTFWSVWCYDCDEEINISCKKKLLEAVEYLKKQADSNNKTITMQQPENKPLETIPLPSPTTVSFNKSNSTQLNSFPRARGLSNLGNTCFFNSVMQCLGQTPYLLELLEQSSMPGQFFRLPGGSLNIADKNSINVEPIEGKLSKWKPITETLAETLRELQSGRAEAYIPRMLLSKLTHRMPQFGGGDQHDSHELLRHLLEAVREEDIKRYKAVILDQLGLREADPSTVDEDQKKTIKLYGAQAETLLPTEQVFRGSLVSTLQCQECYHTSHRDELFLDLSLPVAEKQVPPVLRRKAEEIEDKPSKHQIKKEKRAERKKNKKQKSHITFITNKEIHVMEKSDSESDADVEDNVEDLNSNQQKMDDNVIKGIESGYNSDKLCNSSPDLNNKVAVLENGPDDSGIQSPAVENRVKFSSSSPDNSPSSSETNVYIGSPLLSRSSPVQEPMEMERPESRLSFRNAKGNDLKTCLEKLILNDGDSNKVNNFQNDNESTTSNSYQRIINQEDEKMEEDCQETTDKWTRTFSPRYQCEEGECSVQSCLNQFTSLELLNGYNKVSCDNCTQKHGGNDKKPVYNNATKQLLIYNPPAVLILHLKRFQVCRYRPAKVSKYVKFPTLLDLAPFCSKRTKDLPSFENSRQTKILYSLYGVVEHSGSMHGGHYIAYVKVRSRLDENNYRWQFLPKNQTENNNNSQAKTEGEPDVPPGKWYYISDSYVSECNEAKVLQAQAYLLFYERIL